MQKFNFVIYIKLSYKKREEALFVCLTSRDVL